MIPNYLTFIRFQNKRLLAFLFLILLVVLGFYWKNNACAFAAGDVGPLSGVLAITLYGIIYELKAYWAYSRAMQRIDFAMTTDKAGCRWHYFLSQPAVISLCSLGIFWLMVKGCLQAPAYYNALCLYLASTLFIYLCYIVLRPVYIRQVFNPLPDKITPIHLNHYVGRYLILSTLLSVLSVTPLDSRPDFSLDAGFLSPALMVAMLILCAAVISINLLFARISKRYIFFGKMYLKEIDFYFSTAMPFAWLYRQALLVRILLLLGVMAVWIPFIGILLSALNGNVTFSVYFLLCFLPAAGYHFLHLYWHWHNEFLMACDMSFRCAVINQRHT